jgi:hypothetical protein
VKRARYEYSAKNPKVVERRAADPKAHVPGASAGQHIRVREVVTELLGGKVTPSGIVGLTGLGSMKDLKAVASWDPKVDMSPLAKSELAARLSGDAWQQGRFLCAILVVYAEEIASAATPGGKASAS